MSSFTLRADLREIRSGIINTINELRADNVIVPADKYEFIEEVLTVGDYVIECGNYVLIIERKAIADLAASIVDRRIYENHKKLIEAAATDCGLQFRVMYLIEGKQFKPEMAPYKVAGIPVANLRAKIDHLMMEDGCQIEWTTNTKHTAMRIVELGKNMMTLKQPEVIGGNEEEKVDVGAIVKKTFTKSIAEIQFEMMTSIPGVGPKTAKILLNEHPFGRIIFDAEIQFNKISKKAYAELKELRAGNRNVAVRSMLTKIKGISVGLAATVIESYSVVLLADPELVIDTLADLKRTNGKRLGSVLANRIAEHFAQPNVADDSH
jgi:ERCC4-type nuclease